MNLLPYNPISRYGFSRMPDDSVPVEIVRASGAVQIAKWRGEMWYEAKRTINAIDDPVAFWRYIP